MNLLLPSLVVEELDAGGSSSGDVSKVAAVSLCGEGDLDGALSGGFSEAVVDGEEHLEGTLSGIGNAFNVAAICWMP